MDDKVIAIDRYTNGSDDPLVSERQHQFDPQVERSWETGIIDWYDHTRSYGFVRADSDGRQRFLHRKVVIKAYRREFPNTAPPKHIDLAENQRVKFRSSPSDRGGRDEVTDLQVIRR